MAEYLHPGVYVEEFDSGAVPMAGVGTSTAGFVGVAERGPVGGEPRLVTGFADFKRNYGGYLGEAEFGDCRWLAYSVEQFFAQGGTRAFISRVAPTDAAWAKSGGGGGYTLSMLAA
jgi:phage tail sheath protein FI